MHEKITRRPADTGYTEWLDTITQEPVLSSMAEGIFMADIARTLDIPIDALCKWMAKNPERKALMKEARAIGAEVFDRKAEEVLTEAKDKTSIARARELAQHYRWRASKFSPKDYGDRLEVEQHGTLTTLSDAALQARIVEIERKIVEQTAPPSAEGAG